jgi:hypothetical protein
MPAIEKVIQQDDIRTNYASLLMMARLEKRLTDYAHPEKYNVFIDQFAELSARIFRNSIKLANNKRQSEIAEGILPNVIGASLDILASIMQSDLPIDVKQEWMSITLLVIVGMMSFST